MLARMLAFEIRYRLNRVSTYVYFAAFFLYAFFSVAATGFGPAGTGRVLLNGPYTITLVTMPLMAVGMFIVSAIFGTSILRDFEDDTYQLVFTKPIPKAAYLGGRWGGSLVVCAAIFVAIPAGMLLGSLMPWVDQERLAPFQSWWYVQPYLTLVLATVFWQGSLFFFLASVTRRLMVVYLQGVVLLGIYLVAAVYVLNNTSRIDTFWPSVFDPIGMVLEQSVTKYWTVADKNTQLLTWTGAVLYNRLFWMMVGVVSLVATFALFPMSAERLTTRRMRTRLLPDQELETVGAPARHVAAARQTFGSAAWAVQFGSLFRLNLWTVIKEVPFWAIALIMFVLAIINGNEAGRWYGSNSWPVTYLMMQAVNANSLFLYVIAVLYAGELVWKQRDVRFHQIHDATPVPSWLNFASQFSALAVIQVILNVALILAGILLQTWHGYYTYEVSLYLKENFLIWLPNVLSVIALALLTHTLVSNKFLAHGIVIGLVVIIPVLQRYGFENRLYLFSELTPYTYSDMNGYGHFVPALVTITVYWSAVAALFGVGAILFARRGTDTSFRERLKEARRRFTGPAMIAAACSLAVAAAAGGWYHYNTRVLNPFRTAKTERERQASYEKKYRRLFLAPQPKVTDVAVEVQLYPERRSFAATGVYTLANRHAQAIDTLYVFDSRESIRRMEFDRAFQLAEYDKEQEFRAYRLTDPIRPGETMRLSFDVGYEPRGFVADRERNELAFNGMFFDMSYFPSIGYEPAGELQNPTRRRELGLGPPNEMPLPTDASVRDVSLFTPNAEWVTFKATVSTSADQVPIAPGYVTREWTADGRRHREYQMGDTRINNFFSFVSGRYQVLRDEHKGVPIEIYYHPGHEYNLERMVDSTKKGLDYFGANFSPYQFKGFRILEFPRYRNFAQSFPNTVPYSEALGFIMRFERPDEDIDEIFYITAHELAHQWWGHQIVGNYAQGSNILSETLAQYSALMIMEKEYGPNQMRKFLRYELDRYLRGRGAGDRKEPPLTLVQNEPYVWYQKGSVVMYALRDYIGEERVNTALRKLLADRGFAQSNHPTSLDLVRYLRAETPPELQSVITDMFEQITLFDNRAVTATVTPVGGKYRVKVTVDARKLRADGSGVETEVGVDDLIDVGVFAGTTAKPEPLVLEKRRISARTTTFEFTVDTKPTRAGIDPYHKLVDRNPEDNWMPVADS